jgi:hypothetical protein
MNFRTIAASAAMLACLSLASTPTRVLAETAATKPATVQPKAHARPGKGKSAAVTRNRQAKAQHGKKARIALARHRQRPAVDPVEDDPETMTLARPEISAPTRQETSAARRFREFLNPQSFAVAVGEELRKPRLLAAHLTGETADPQIIAAAWNGAIESDPPETAEALVAQDEAVGDHSPSPTAILAHSDAAEVRRVVARTADNNEPARMSFVRWFFVAWGGVLTFASALRMAVG